MKKFNTLFILSIISISTIITFLYYKPFAKNDTYSDFLAKITKIDFEDNAANLKPPEGFFNWIYVNLKDLKLNYGQAINIVKLMQESQYRNSNETLAKLEHIYIVISLRFAIACIVSENEGLNSHAGFALNSSFKDSIRKFIECKYNGSSGINVQLVKDSLANKILKLNVNEKKLISDFLTFLELADAVFLYEAKYNRFPESLESLGFKNQYDPYIKYENYILKFRANEINFPLEKSKYVNTSKIKIKKIRNGFEIRNVNSEELNEALNEFSNSSKVVIIDSDINFNAIKIPSTLKSIFFHNSKVEGLDKLDEITILSLLNSVFNSDELSNLINLTYLELSDTDFKDLRVIKNLTKLEYLIANNTKIESLSGIENLLDLVWLNLKNTSVKDVSALKNHRNIIDLNLDNTDIEDIMPLENVFDKASQTKKSYPVAKLSIIQTSVPQSQVDFFNLKDHISVAYVSKEHFKPNGEYIKFANSILSVEI